jgi:hypothetical protein
MSGAKLVFMNTVSSFLACASAGALNAYFMRRNELSKGVNVRDEHGHNYGLS